MDKFRHPTLTYPELKIGCKLGLDTWSDTSSYGKHAFVEELMEGKTVTETGFTEHSGALKYLPIDNVYYAYDNTYVKTIQLEHKNKIYLGDQMSYSLGNPIKL